MQFSIQVQNAANPVLGQNGQGLCGVKLHFSHNFIGDLLITLTSPVGKTITLVGPVGTGSGATPGSTWDVGMVRCSDFAQPDPLIDSTWSNFSSWGFFGHHNGDYYPYGGCLEQLDSGSVNGIWTLNIIDGLASDAGFFYGFELNFCDTTGMNCFTCESNAGNLLQPDQTYCEGFPGLKMNLPPSYALGDPPPPAGLYKYNYVISQAGTGVILAYDSVADLRAYPPGNYSICGLSFYNLHQSKIPLPNGTITVGQLRNQLNSSTPPFCGKITSNCVNVTITSGPPDILDTLMICGNTCYNFYGQLCCVSGTYSKLLSDSSGCRYQATVVLTVLPLVTVSLSETICKGSCAASPGFTDVCQAGFYERTFTGANGCDSLVQLSVTEMEIESIIATPDTLNCAPGATIVLDGQLSTSGANYQWWTSSGGSLPGATNASTALAGAPGQYYLRVCQPADYAICCDTSAIIVPLSANYPEQPLLTSSETEICLGQTILLSTPPVFGLSYSWNIPTGVTAINGQNSNAISLLWNTPGSAEVCLTTINDCGPGIPSCIQIFGKTVPEVTTLTGSQKVCSGSTTLFSANAPSPVDAFNWTVSPPNHLLNGQGTDSIWVTWAGGLAEVCVQGVNQCGSGPYLCLEVEMDSVPTVLGISGSTEVCAGNTINYQVLAENASLFEWIISGGGIISSQNSNAATINWGVEPSGQLCIIAANSCGHTLPWCQSIEIASADAGILSGQELKVCEGLAFQVFHQEVPNLGAGDAGIFVLSEDINTASINYLAASADGNFNASQNPGPGNYFITYIAGKEKNGLPDPDDPCLSISNAQPLKIIAVQKAEAGSDQMVCGFNGMLSGNPSLSSGLWELLSGPSSADIDKPDEAITSISVTQAGVYQFSLTQDNGACTSSDTTVIIFNEIPQISQIEEHCLDDFSGYQLIFSANSGSPPYTVSGISGKWEQSTFYSDSLSNGTFYFVKIMDSQGCSSTEISDSANCACTTSAGSFQALGPVSVFCAGEPALANWNNDADLKPGDTIFFVLHTTPGLNQNNILLSSKYPVFYFNNNIKTGINYYISAVAGPSSGNLPFFSRPCVSFSQSVPVRWRALPAYSLESDSTTCFGQPLGIQITASGDSTVLADIQIEQKQKNFYLQPGSPETFDFQPQDSWITIQLNLQYIQSPACAFTAVDTLWFMLQQPVSSGVLVGTTTYCAGELPEIDLDTLLFGAESGGIWSGHSPTSVPIDSVAGVLQSANWQPGIYSFRYQIAASGPCPAVFTDISLTVNPNPVAQAGQDTVLACGDGPALLGGENSSAGPGIAYHWQRDGLVLAENTLQILTDVAGLYWFTVSDTVTGCEATDSVLINISKDIPVLEEVELQPIRCRGEKNGVIQVLEISGAFPPYRLSFNQGPFVLDSLWDGLSAGTYSIQAIDSKGCEGVQEQFTLEEPNALTASLGADQSFKLGDSIHLQLATNIPFGQIDTIIWTPLFDPQNAGQLRQDFLIFESQDVTVQVYDENGCPVTAHVKLNLDHIGKVFIPNIFSRSSSENGIFMIYGSKEVSEIELLRVFDRWGKVIFEKFSFPPGQANSGWDGTFEGQIVPPGVYMYQARVRFSDDARITLWGDVTVVP